MKYNCKTPKELLKKIKNEDIKMVDLRFTDLPGSTHHISIPFKYLSFVSSIDAGLRCFGEWLRLCLLLSHMVRVISFYTSH